MEREHASLIARRWASNKHLIGYRWEPISNQALIGPKAVVFPCLFPEDFRRLPDQSRFARSNLSQSSRRSGTKSPDSRTVLFAQQRRAILSSHWLVQPSLRRIMGHPLLGSTHAHLPKLGRQQYVPSTAHATCSSASHGRNPSKIQSDHQTARLADPVLSETALLPGRPNRGKHRWDSPDITSRLHDAAPPPPTRPPHRCRHQESAQRRLNKHSVTSKAQRRVGRRVV